MTAYAFNAAQSSSLAVKAVNFEIRIVRFEFDNESNSLPAPAPYIYFGNITRYSGASISGGSSVSCVPMRENAPNPTALCYSGASVSGSGVSTAFYYSSLGPSRDVFQPPEDLTCKPGSAFYIGGSSNLTIYCYFEELRLAWHY